MSTPTPAELFELARSVGLRAADYVRANRPDGRVEVAATKSSPTDVVTAVDRGCEELIRSLVLGERPDDGFLGEEGDDVIGTSAVRWIVDPIDGTVNFIYGIPSYSVAIAAEVDGVVEAGFVVNIATGEQYGGMRGGGSFRLVDGARLPLRPGTVTDPAFALVATGFHYVVEIREAQAAAMSRLLPRIRDVRRIGSAALDLCSLADGRFDAYVEQGLHPWDLAAARVIAEEAGIVFAGLATGPDGAPDGEPDERLVMAAPTGLAGEFFALVRACGF